MSQAILHAFRCRNLVPAHVLAPTGRRVACQAPAVGVWDVGDRRTPLCADCAGPGRLACEPFPLATAADIPGLVAAGTCWCHLARTGLAIIWCPRHGMQQDEEDSQ